MDGKDYLMVALIAFVSVWLINRGLKMAGLSAWVA